MSDLPSIQKKFQDYLFYSKENIKKHIVSTDKLAAEPRLAIYSNAYRARLSDVLAVSFPILKIYLGSELFDDLCLAYIDKYHSDFRSIRWFGDKMSVFVGAYILDPDASFLSELAKLEWTMALVFDGPNGPAITLERMSTIAPEEWVDLRFKMHPSALFIDLYWNVIQVWQQITNEQTPGPAEKSEHPVSWVFWRQELTSRFYSLADDEAWALKAAREGSSFGQICEGLCRWTEEEEVGLRAASLLKNWIHQGLISAIYVN